MKNNSRKTDESNSLGESLDDSLTIIQVKSAGVSSTAKKLSQQRDKTRLKAKHKNQYENQDRTIIVKPEAVDAVKLKQELADKTRILKKSTSSDNSTRIMSGKKNRASDATKLTTGSIINNRFVLEEVLGVGGMGKVYKAVDLRKKEARDKNPYIAIKVLNDEFREHPESLIALQREARKSQQLSHPNIVNVHDFDRDGDVVYMTMELLQGRSLDEVIANDYPHGMTEEQATPIINAIANAVLYAHQHAIVHSDLKPSNIFITDDNKAKIFDFGIARACKISQEQIDSTHTRDKTLFDPTELGALTPTYASLEMLQGEAPEPHDDIYSIACVFYELLTGEHPYQRMPADKAKDKIANKSLRIKKIAALRKSFHKEKNKAILKALEISGKDRFDNLELFIQAYNYKKKSKTPFIVSVLALVIILGIIFYPKIQEEYYFKQQAHFIAMVQSLQVDSQQNEFLSINEHIISLDVKTKEYVLENIKSHWLSLVENRIEALLKGNHYNEYFEHDSILLKMTQTYYPDSARVARLFESFEKQKFVEINRLNSQFNELLENLQVSELSSQSSEQAEIFKIINAVKGIEETHPLVKDQRLLLVYQSNIERLLNEYNLEEANSLLVKAELIFPDEILLQNLVDKSKSLELSNDNKLLNNDGHAFDNKVKNKLSSFSISNLKQKLVKRLEESDLSDEWDADVTQIYTQLNSKLGKRSTWLNEKKQTLASLYMQQSVIMRDKERLIEARRFLEKAKQYNSSIFGIEDEEAILLALENIVRVKHKAKQRLAKIAGLKTSLTTQLKAQEMQVDVSTLFRTVF
ncbi:serine/threonine-protein kinase [sulfur-oxidizing endosymbiont of Gigantopelta aegis]|uniref:serine/threonine-protein kinase n=1 Tax=sulfur-oxidizing endosymbiont of Gigantopelta aegis TaxID=2794934 RepID=UPI0018DD0756|nr:serine/threonine-protein kinase [sulfur-oxidizing endosymbiont of Gigantopelta aegis]